MIVQEVPRNEWPLGRIMETSTDQQGLVRAVKIKLGFRNSQKKESDARKQVIERPVQKVVLLMEGVSLRSSNFKLEIIHELSILPWKIHQ